ncbi:MAG TPA: S8 family serine peptidase [Streptosporangiaceae bacterium]|nr:S8 family serine peptidase [Streptosporangiaceae bacterium]
MPEVPKLTTVPWPQQRFDFDRIWKITTGTGIKVAVVDTGVDDRHPQLAGRVTSLDVTKTYLEDTCGHGTEVAGIIGAKDMRDQDRPLVGIAPGAKIVSVKYTNGEHSAGADPNLPKAIRRAADVKGVRVINVSSTSPDSPELRSAVKYAQSRDILIVAAAGNIRNDQQGKETPAYPAGYDGVIGVAAMDENGQVTDFSNERTQIAVAAPGAAIPSTRPGGVYHPGDNGTSFATPFVSGLAALVWAFHKDLDYQQVANRIEVTAEGTGGAGTGRGMVNPYEAITAEISDTAPPALAQPKVAVRPVRIDPPPPVDTRTRGIALAVTFGALGAAAMVSVAAVVIPMGRRRGWRPGRVELPREPSRPRG